MKQSTLSALVLASLLLISAYSVAVLAAKPPKAALTVTISGPSDGIEVENGGSFTVSGNVISKRGDAGTVETFVQYAKGEGSTDFADVDGTDLQIIAGVQPQIQVLLQDESYDVSWMLTGDSGTYELRIFSQGSMAKSGASESRTVTIQGSAPPPPPPGIETIDAEYQDPDIGFGISSGTYVDTYLADGVYEVLTEEKNRQGTKKPVDDTTELGWIYVFEGLGERQNATFWFSGRASFAPGDSDTAFYVQEKYSGSWSTIMVITNTGVDILKHAPLPDDTSETILIRIIDDDQSIGNKEISSLFVDQVCIRYKGESPESAGTEILVGGPDCIVAWEHIDHKWYEDYEWTTKSPPMDLLVADIDSDGQPETIVAEYYCKIEIFKNNAGVMELIHTLLHPTNDGNPVGGVMSLAVGDFDNDESAFLEILSCVDHGKTATIWKMGSTTYEPIFNITLPSLGDAVAAGDLDGDGDIEIVVTAGIGIPGSAMVYDYIDGTWINTATYEYPDPQDDRFGEVNHAEVNDVNNDDRNELVLSHTFMPLLVLNYTGSELTELWNYAVDTGRTTSFVTGDATNDGLIDIVLVDGSIYADAILVFETVGGTIANTFNISDPDLPLAEGNGIALGDIDGDGLNEYVTVGTEGGDLYYMRIFRNDTMIEKKGMGFAKSCVVRIADYDGDAPGGFGSEATAGSEGIDSQTSGVVIATIPVKKQE